MRTCRERPTEQSTTLLLLLLIVGLTAACGGQTSDDLQLSATVDGRSIDDATTGDPIRIETETEGVLVLEVTNPTSDSVQLDHVRLEGEVLDMTFLSYGTGLDVSVSAGATQVIEIPLDFFDLERQATGYMRSAVRVYDDEKVRRGSTGFPADVRGKIRSTMGLFAAGLLIVTISSLALNLRAVARRLLPPNRFQRGLRFLTTGLGFGLLLTVGLAVLRIVALPTAGWLPIVLICAAASFALGYLSPGVLGDDLDDDFEDLEEEMETAANS